MPRFNKNVDFENHYTLPAIESLDTFNHLPTCSSKVLQPLLMQMPPAYKFSEQAAPPEKLVSDAEAITWFYTLVDAACRGYGTSFDEQDFVHNTVEGYDFFVTGALKSYQKAWVDNSSDLSTNALVPLTIELTNLCENHAADREEASDEARMLYALTGEFMEKASRSILMDRHVEEKGTFEFDGQFPLQIRSNRSWEDLVPEIVAARYLDSGKCLYTYSRMADLFGLTSCFYMSQLQSLESNQDHTDCSIDQCVGHNINPETHKHVHVSPGCTCELISADLDAMAKILKEPDQIPVMVFEHGKELKIRIVPQNRVQGYIAISYAASQMLASPNSNSLPKCQMLALRHILRYCFRGDVAKGEQYGLWIDTHHVPVEAVRTVSREQALMKMQMTFEKALIVLVVDPYLSARTWTAPEPAEFMAYFLSSPWFTRLWTFSESQLAENLWVWYAGRPRSVEQFLQQEGWPPKGTTWRRGDETEMIGRLRTISPVYLDPAKKAERLKSHSYFDIIMLMLRHRMTSQPSDEAFCLSMLMRLDTDKILKAPREDRMETWYGQLQNLSGILLIQSGPRLCTPGFRWAPKTLLGRKQISRNGHEADHTQRRDGIGIRVPDTYFAYRLTIVGNANGGSDTISPPTTRRLFYRLSLKTIFGELVWDQKPDDTARLVTFNLSTECQVPGDEYEGLFTVPGQQFICMIRGWVSEGGKGPCVILQPEAPPGDLAEQTSAFLDLNSDKKKIFTRYCRLGMYRLQDLESTESLTEKYQLDSAFEGIDPCTEARLVCHAEEIDLKTTDIWVS